MERGRKYKSNERKGEVKERKKERKRERKRGRESETRVSQQGDRTKHTA